MKKTNVLDKLKQATEKFVRKNCDRIIFGSIGFLIAVGGFGCIRTIDNLQMQLKSQQEMNKELKQEYVNLYDLSQKLNDSCEQMTNDYEALNKKYKKLKSQTSGLMETVNELDSSNQSLKAENETMLEDLHKYEERAELFDKYEYAIYDDAGNRTDLSYEQIKSADTLMKEKGLDTNLLLSLAMTESSGKANATSKISTARGYGQLLKGTATFVYQDIMNAGYYSHDMAYNPYTNIDIMANYLAYLKENNDNVYDLIYDYRGERDYPYLCKVGGYLRKGGTSLENLNTQMW